MTAISTLPLPPTATSGLAGGLAVPVQADFSAVLAQAPEQHGQPDAGHPGLQPEPYQTKFVVPGNAAVVPANAPPVLAPCQVQSTAPKKAVSRSEGELYSLGATPAEPLPDRGMLLQSPEPITTTSKESPVAEQATGTPSAAQVTWSRVFAQHWLANGYLSLVVQPDAQPVLAEPESASRAVSKTSMPAPPFLTARGAHRPSAQVEGDLPLPEPMPATVSVSQEQETLGMAERLSRWAPVVAADRAWADRLVRISRREDGAATLWLRDFSLAPEQIGRTVQSLIDQARHEGLSLHRIMVNGHPVWQATHQQGSK
jgi:hypothetical protein